MIKLSDRLQMIADEIRTGETMADIGTDHGFLPIYLWENKISPKVIMADVSKGSLEKAEDNGRLLYPEESFDLRLGDGLAVLDNGEVDAVAIAGMGGILMTQILGADLEKALSMGKYILQPRISSGKLRHWLLHHGFSITNDQLVREGKFICNVITAVSKEHDNLPEIEASYDSIMAWDEEDIRMDVPFWHKKDALIGEYIGRRIHQEQQVIKGLESASSQWRDKIDHTSGNIAYLEELRNEIK